MAIIIFFFSIIAFRNLSFYYVEEDDESGYFGGSNTYCDTLFNCFTSTLNTGLRTGGGIGEGIGQAYMDDDKNYYWWRILYDMAWFFLINVLMLNIIFGIIIDSFAELRDLRNAKQKEIEDVCLICGINKKDLKLRRLSWNQHKQKDHEPIAYLAFILHINNETLENSDGAEKYVKE